MVFATWETALDASSDNEAVKKTAYVWQPGITYGCVEYIKLGHPHAALPYSRYTLAWYTQ